MLNNTLKSIKIIASIALFFQSLLSLGQTYTFDSSNTGCTNNQWSNANCWDKSNNTGPSGCTVSAATIPPYFPTVSGSRTPCDVNVIINESIVINGNVEFGGGFNSITVANGATLTVNGNFTINGSDQISIITNEGGGVRINGQVNIETASSLIIDGDNSGFVRADDIDFDNDGKIFVRQNGFLHIRNETKLRGKDVLLDVKGTFRTSSFSVSGNNATLDVNDAGILLVEGNFSLQGQGVVEVRGNSLVEVGGSLQTNSNGNGLVFSVEATASFYVCGGLFNPDTIPPAMQEEVNVDQNGCRILPINYQYVSAKLEEKERIAHIQFATLQEWNNGHFEIQRSDNQIGNFQTVASLNSAGWSNEPKVYEYQDGSLPILAGHSFYRIKQVDMDNNESFSKVVGISYPGISSKQGTWHVYPNPSEGSAINIAISNPENYHGEEIYFKLTAGIWDISTQKVESPQSLQTALRETIIHAPSGILFLEIQWGKEIEVLKVWKK